MDGPDPVCGVWFADRGLMGGGDGGENEGEERERGGEMRTRGVVGLNFALYHVQCSC